MSLERELLEPARTAVLVVDVQNDFCSPEGATARAGRSVQSGIDMIPQLERLVNGARPADVHVIFIQTAGSHWTDSQAWITRALGTPRPPICREGTRGAEFYGVAPAAGEAVVVKHRNSAFLERVSIPFSAH